MNDSERIAAVCARYEAGCPAERLMLALIVDKPADPVPQVHELVMPSGIEVLVAKIHGLSAQESYLRAVELAGEHQVDWLCWCPTREMVPPETLCCLLDAARMGIQVFPCFGKRKPAQTILAQLNGVPSVV